MMTKENLTPVTLTELNDNYCWEKHFQLIPKEVHKIQGLGNFTHSRSTSSQKPTIPHYHTNIMEIHCVVSGTRKSCLFQSGITSTYLIHGNQGFIVFPGEPHFNGSDPQEPCEYYAVQIDLSDRDHLLGLDQEYSNILCDRLLALKYRHFRMSTTSIYELRTSFNLFTSTDPFDRRCAVQFLTCFLFNIFYMTPIKDDHITKIDSNIQLSLDYIERNYQTHITLTDLALESGYSLSRFKVRFKEELGITPSNYVAQYRMEHAKQLLTQTSQSITDIAFALGFSTSNYFCSVFKKLVGCNPNQYRKKHKE